MRENRRSISRLILITAVTLPLFWAAGQARAVGGPLEINQFCAMGPAGCFPGDSPGFPVEITSSGSYVLTGDLVVSDINAHGIEVLTEGGISIDLRGFTIRGPAVCTGAQTTLTCTPGGGEGVRYGFPFADETRIRLSNGRITGFAGRGVVLRFYSHAKNLVVEANGGIGLTAEDGSIVSNSVAANNANFGVIASTGLVHDNRAIGNRFSGFSSIEGLFTRSAARANANDGFVGQRSLWHAITASDNLGFGVSEINRGFIVGGSFTGNLVGVATTFDSSTQHNTFRSNTDVGLRVNSNSYGWNTLSDHSVANVDQLEAGTVNLGENVCSGAPCP